jgi:hypothetical protein
LTVFLLCLIAGCNSVELRSHWRTGEIVIDGNNAEWQDSLTYLLEDKQTSVGFLNDYHDIYVCLISANHDLQRQAMRQGLTFWFDREGSDAKIFGIHYPLRAGRPPGRAGDEGARDEGTQGDDDRPPDFQNENTPAGANEVEIYGPAEGDRRRMTMAETGGIEARVRMTNGLLVYEMRMPLTESGSHPYTIGMKSGSVLGVGIEAIRIQDRPRDQTSEGEEGRGGGYGGRGGGRGGRGGRGGGGGERSGGQPEPFKFWTKVQLAIPASSAQ